MRKTKFRFFGFVYMPHMHGPIFEFFSTLTKIDVSLMTVYLIDIPNDFAVVLRPISRIENPKFGFQPHFQGFSDLIENPRECNGAIVLEIISNDKDYVGKTTYATVIKCCIAPV